MSVLTKDMNGNLCLKQTSVHSVGLTGPVLVPATGRGEARPKRNLDFNQGSQFEPPKERVERASEAVALQPPRPGRAMGPQPPAGQSSDSLFISFLKRFNNLPADEQQQLRECLNSLTGRGSSTRD